MTTSKKHLEIALGGNMNTSTLTAFAIEEIMTDFAKQYHKEQLILSGVSQQRELLFCGGCGNKKQLIVETDINSQRVCKNKLCKQNNY